MKAGEIKSDQIQHHIDRSRLLKSLGNPVPLQPTIPPTSRPSSTQGDAFLLCTDGFWENVFETEMQADLAVARSAAEWLARLQNRLLRRMSDKQDNYSAIAIFPLTAA